MFIHKSRQQKNSAFEDIPQQEKRGRSLVIGGTSTLQKNAIYLIFESAINSGKISSHYQEVS